MEPVRVGVAGAGWWGGELMRGGLATGAIVGVACHSTTAASRQRFAAEQGMRAADNWDDLLVDPDIEAILIATPHSTHARLVAEAAGAGKHVFVEKPFTLDVDGANAAIAAANDAGVVLQVGHQRRRQTATRRIRQMVEAGDLGTLVMADTNMSGSSGLSRADGNWRSDPGERPLSGMTPYGVHVIDALHYLMGPVSAVAASRADVIVETSLDDATVVVLQFASGAVGMLGTSTSVPTTARIGVLGSEGSAWNLDDGARLAVQTLGDKVATEVEIEPTDTVADQMAEFARCVRTGGAPETGGAEGLHVVGVLEAARESALTGRTVAVRADAGGLP